MAPRPPLPPPTMTTLSCDLAEHLMFSFLLPALIVALARAATIRFPFFLVVNVIATRHAPAVSEQVIFGPLKRPAFVAFVFLASFADAATVRSAAAGPVPVRRPLARSSGDATLT